MSRLGSAFGLAGSFAEGQIEDIKYSYNASKAQSDVEQAKLEKMYFQQMQPKIQADNERAYREEQAAQEMRNRAYRELMEANATSKQINVQEINKASQSVASKVSDTQSTVSIPNESFDINKWNEGAQKKRERHRERIVKSDDNERFKREILNMLDGISSDIRECVDKQSILTMRLDNLEGRVANSLSGGKVLFSEGGGILSQSYKDMMIDRNIDSMFK